MNSPILSLSSLQLALIAVIALGIGIVLYFWRDWIRRWRLNKDLKRMRGRSIRNKDYGESRLRTTQHEADAPKLSKGVLGLIELESVTIKNFKNISELKLELMRPSSLSGEWTCIAGINGAGKTSILQAICVVLLGHELVPELGRTRLGRMLRRTLDGTFDAEIEAYIRHNGQRTRLYIPLTKAGTGKDEAVVEGAIDTDTLRKQPDYEAMLKVWANLRQQVVVGYGASRNVSDFRDPRHSNLSRTTQRQMSLFDPLTQLASVETLLEGGEKARPALETLYRLIRLVLDSSELRAEPSMAADKLRFSMHGTSMDVIDLPDGFRSTVAWLADLCTDWTERAYGTSDVSDPSAITGIVLLDEIGLHMHPSMEKALVPQLRRALPRVQFIVSTHSPLVLSGFDRDELVVLDSSEPAGTRQLDRQVFGLTMDDVYAWLMNTSPGSPIMEQMLSEASDREVAVYMYQSKDVNEQRARELIDERQRRIKNLESELKK